MCLCTWTVPPDMASASVVIVRAAGVRAGEVVRRPVPQRSPVALEAVERLRFDRQQASDLSDVGLVYHVCAARNDSVV